MIRLEGIWYIDILCTKVLDLLSATVMILFTQRPDAALEDRIAIALATQTVLGLLIILQIRFQTASLFNGLCPAAHKL